MNEQISQKILKLDDAKKTAIEIREACEFSSGITKILAEEIHKDFDKKHYSTKVWLIDAINLANLVITRGCNDGIINAARTLLLVQNGIIKDAIRSNLCIPVHGNRLFKLANVDRATVIWFTSAISEYHYKEQQKAISAEERKMLFNAEYYCYDQLYKFLCWCQEQSIIINFKDKNGIQEAIRMFVNRSEQAKHHKYEWLKGIVEALKLVGFEVSDFINEIIQRIGVCEGFSPELVNAVEEFLSMKSNPNNPKRFYVDGYGNIPKQKMVKVWKKTTLSGVKYCVFGLYGYCAKDKKISRDEISLWAPTREQIEKVPNKHTIRWWESLESWFGYLYSRPDIPKKYKKVIQDLLNNSTALVPHSEGKKAAFLTPLELVKVEKLLETISTDGHAMKIKIMFLLGCLAGLRAFEIVQVTLNMFDRDRETGLLKLDKEDRAILRLPYEKSKGEYSPSHPEFGTIIVPYLAKIINAYLRTDAMKGAVAAANQGKKSKNVYLVHKGKHWSEGKLCDEYVVKFFQNPKHKNILSQALVHHPAGTTFSAHDLRHSCNDFILSLAIRWRSNGRIAEIHERHNQSRRGSSVNIRHYSRDVSKNAYYNAVSYALGFTWDEASVKEWMNAKGYDDEGNLPDELEFLPGISNSQNSQSISPQIPSANVNGTSSSSPEKIQEVVDNLKQRQKQISADVKNRIIKSSTASERFKFACEQAISQIKQMMNN